MHRGFIPVNAFGVLCAVGYAGYATTPSHIPWAGYAATLLFFTAALAPIVREFRRIGIGFVDIENEYMSNRQRELSPPKQEIIEPQVTSAQYRPGRRRFNGLLYLISAMAIVLLVSDITYRQMHLPVRSDTDHIRNF
ncbi:MAG: hypothetical protein HQ483_01600 [Rhodospirillales bacterium]|nr:hypothetical protein [Rhodospirillales bacterium]